MVAFVLTGAANHRDFTGSEFSVQAAFFSSLLVTRHGGRKRGDVEELHESVFRAGCLDPNDMAAYIDGRADASGRTRLEAHLADCDACREVFAECVRTPPAGADAAATPVPGRRRLVRGLWAGGFLAAAAAVVVFVQLARTGRLSPGAEEAANRPVLDELIAAAAKLPARPTEARLTGGFPYAPPPSALRGTDAPAVPPDVRLAAAKLEKLATEHDTPETWAAAGVAYLTLKDADSAITALERAASRRRDSRLDSDLAAAYLTRAWRTDRTDDWERARAAASRALETDPNLREAQFNLSLAFEGLHRTDDARAAWARYLEIEPDSAWATEARQRLEVVSRP
jgi:tetratricopeptide (TPR) repeat protein